MKRNGLLLLLCAALAGCAAPPPSFSDTGVFPSGGTIVVHNLVGDIDAFAPARGEPADMYTLDAYEPPNVRAVTVSKAPLVLRATATKAGVRFLVRGPKDGTMNLQTEQGSIMVADFEGIVNAKVGHGTVTMLIPKYGNVWVGKGDVSVIFASTSWPGTLHFSTQTGNIALYVNQNAKAMLNLHTGDGTVYSDFPIRGSSHGTAETIDAPINGGGPRSIDVSVGTGSIRVMQLKPQV